MPNLTWTRERPTEPGWYWWRTHYVRGERKEYLVRIFRLFDHDGRLYAAHLSFVEEMVAGEWAGPIPQPEEVRT